MAVRSTSSADSLVPAGARSARKDRKLKRRIEIPLGRFTLNPFIRALFRIGITPPGMALLETTGRRSGKVRRVPVMYYREGSVVWVIAQHGAHSGWVRNFQTDPHVRMRFKGKWEAGMAKLLPDDDPRERAREFGKSRLGKRIALANLRALETEPRTVRVELGAN
jgi:deazaflavin-dependent oxidoreductase (nitroreductase family)